MTERRLLHDSNFQGKYLSLRMGFRLKTIHMDIRKTFIPIIILAVSAIGAAAQVSEKDFNGFDRDFENKTLRLDYVFAGNARSQQIHFREALSGGIWAGRRHSLDSVCLDGNGRLEVLDPQTGDVLYVNTFSTLFQEWLSQEEATFTDKAFEECFQVPFPRRKVDIRVTLFDIRGNVTASLTHPVDPTDILIRPVPDNGFTYRYILRSGEPSRCIDLAIVGDGYAAADTAKFFSDAARAVEALTAHDPFTTLKDRFNIVAVAAISQESGVSIPHEGIWKNTLLKCHFDTFYSARYLTAGSMTAVYDALAGVPFEHILVLSNTGVYGGGGIYNSILTCSADHPTFPKVLVHEFGHSFAGLGDEYYYDDGYDPMYVPEKEPWEPNLTTLADFSSKWADMLPKGTPVPTPPDDIEKTQDVRRIWQTLPQKTRKRLNGKLGVYEGGGYLSKGVYRPVQECRMKINECEDFCPVCTRAIIRTVSFYTSD